MSHSQTTEMALALGGSKFNYWFGYVANLLIILFFIVFAALRSPGFHAWQWCSLAVGGLLIWSLIEYIFHRFLYHEFPSLLSVGHQLHHESPTATIGVPWWFTAILIAGVFLGFSHFFNTAAVACVMAFFWLGYVGYCFIHHSIHNFNFEGRVFKTLKRHHLIHHYNPHINWGVTSTLWDHVVGTYTPSPPSKPAGMEAPHEFAQSAVH